MAPSIILIYAFEASLTLAVLYSTYYLFLRSTRFHQLNRFVLIGIAAASLTIPIAANYLPDLAGTPNLIADGYVHYNPPASLLTTIHDSLNPSPNTFQPISPAGIITDLYLLGLAIFLLRAVAPILALQKLIRTNPKNRTPQYTLVHLPQPSPPFSFFRYIFLHKGTYTDTQQKNILLHEQIHIQQYHTLDILFMELYTALFWFHPLAWRLNKLAKLNLEFLADRQLLTTGVAPKEYQYQLVQLSVGPSLTRMVNHFNQSHLKKRIAMMNNNTRRTGSWKYSLFLPSLILLTLGFASPQIKAQAQAQSPAGPAANTDIYLVIRAGTTEKQLLQSEAELQSDGIDLRFSHLQYTPDHQLISLRLVLKQNGRALDDIAIDANGQPITEPIIFYWLRSRNGNPILTRGYPGDLDARDLKILQNLTGYFRNNPTTKSFDLHGAARIGD
jgi:hypothetical protein